MNKTAIALAFAAGLTGGVASHVLVPPSVHAESYPREVRAQSFVLVNDQGKVLGTFAEEAGRPVLKLFDGSRREIWSAGGKASVPAAVLGK